MTIERHMFPPVDPTRRHLLTIAAGGAVAAAIPADALRATPAIDPIFDLIDIHRKAVAAHVAAMQLQNRIEKIRGTVRANWITEKPCQDENDAFEDRDRHSMVSKWRAALVAQLLTPAPDARSVTWKQAALAKGDHRYTDVKPERIERAIADDLAFLAAHPVRRSNSETMARRREFKEAMRQRIGDIAASRDLSAEDIKGVMMLKHHEIAEFTEKHGVNLEWLLEGRGRIFKKDPIRLSPNSTGAEFAAVIATMPMADQQAIRTTVRDIAGARSVKSRRRSIKKRNRQRLATHRRRLIGPGKAS
jgi:hypothetical protein